MQWESPRLAVPCFTHRVTHPQTDVVEPLAGEGGADRLRVLAAAIAAYRVRAFHEVTLEVVAEEAGLDLAAVRACFATSDDLVLAVITVWNGERLGPILPVAERMGAAAFLRSVVVANAADPALMRLLSAMVNIAATPGHPVAPVLQQRWNHFHAVVQRALVHDIAIGREAAAVDAAQGAEQLIALYEGLQLQSMVRPDMDVVAAYERAVARLRDGWARLEPTQLWEL